jgi:hypothetical protein
MWKIKASSQLVYKRHVAKHPFRIKALKKVGIEENILNTKRAFMKNSQVISYSVIGGFTSKIRNMTKISAFKILTFL